MVVKGFLNDLSSLGEGRGGGGGERGRKAGKDIPTYFGVFSIPICIVRLCSVFHSVCMHLFIIICPLYDKIPCKAEDYITIDGKMSFSVYGFLLQCDSRNQKKRPFEEKHDYKQCTKAMKAVVL